MLATYQAIRVFWKCFANKPDRWNRPPQVQSWQKHICPWRTYSAWLHAAKKQSASYADLVFTCFASDGLKRTQIEIKEAKCIRSLVKNLWNRTLEHGLNCPNHCLNKIISTASNSREVHCCRVRVHLCKTAEPFKIIKAMQLSRWQREKGKGEEGGDCNARKP